MSTPSELLPLSEEVLLWVAEQRKNGWVPAADLRRIELMALAVRDQCFALMLYGPDSGSSSPSSGLPFCT